MPLCRVVAQVGVGNIKYVGGLGNAPSGRTRVSKLVAFGTFRVLASGVIKGRLTRLRLPPRERAESGDSEKV